MKSFAAKIVVMTMISVPLVNLGMDGPKKSPKGKLTAKQMAAQKKLIDAVQPGGKIADIAPALQDGANEYYRASYADQGPIFDAIRFDQVAAIHEFARLRRNFNVRFDGDIPLHAAARENNPDVIAALIQGGADVNYRHPELGTTALHVAASQGKTQAIRALLANGADTEIKNKLDNQTADEAAKAAGRAYIAQIIIEHRESRQERRPGLLGSMSHGG